MEDDVLTQLVRDPTSPAELLLVNRGLVGDGGWRLSWAQKPQNNRAFNSHRRRGVSRAATLQFQRADFGLFRGLVDRIPWEEVLKGKGVQEGWTCFKKEILKV